MQINKLDHFYEVYFVCDSRVMAFVKTLNGGLLRCVLILRFLFIASSLFFMGCSQDKPHASDSTLMRLFSDQKSIFNELAAMIEEDKSLERVDDTWVHPDPAPISRERLAKYRRLLKNVGCVRGFSHFSGSKGITIFASCNGLVTGGSAKGYYYSVTPPGPLVADIDSYRQEHTGLSYEVYRHIAGNWYLWYECD